MNRNKTSNLSLVICACMMFAFGFLASGVSGQVPYFRSMKLPDEIHQTSITCLYQDNDYYMWIGSGKGLYQFDGSKFVYFPGTAKEAPLQVSSVFMTNDHILWVGTRKGDIYQLKGDSLQLFETEEGNPKVAITGFAADKQGNLWFSTYGEGVYYFNGTHIYNINSDDGLTDNYCYTILPDDQGRIWVATDGGISVCSLINNKKSIRKITNAEGLPDNIVLSLINDGTTFWAGMQDAGFCEIDPRKLNVSVPKASVNWKQGPVKSIVTGSNWLWLSTEQNGIISIQTTNGTQNGNYKNTGNLNLSRISHMYADKQGNYWVASGNQLFLSLGQNLLQYVESDRAGMKNIHSILYDSKGNVWFSNDEGLFIIDKQTRKTNEINLPLKKSTFIISLYEDDKGYVWAGTFGDGLCCIHPDSRKAKLFTEKEGLSNKNILSIAGKGRQMWLATLGGAYKCDISADPFGGRSHVAFENYVDQGNNYIYSIFIDSRNRVWFGTDGKGISMLDNGKIIHFDKDPGLKSKIIYSITEDSDGGIWLSTANEGLYCYNGKSFRNFALDDGLSDLQITGLLADKNHHLLIVHNNGLDILDTRNNTFLFYGAGVGISGINPDLNVCCLEGGDIAWLGTQNGLIRLQIPSDIEQLQPSLQINKISVFLGKENLIGTHEFSYGQNHISFHFNALWYIAPEQVSYQIRLTGYDIDWLDTRNNMVTYSNLPPGEYTFEVRASMKGNFDRSAVKSYSLRIKEPFWKTNWFIIISVISIALLIYLFIHMRETALKKRDAIYREKILFQFQTLRSQVNPHFLFNSFSTLISIIDEDKEIAIDYVEKLSIFFRNILEYHERDLIPLSEEIKLIDTYFYLQKKRYGDNLDLEIDIRGNAKTSFIPPMVLQMLIENAIKHSVISAEKPLLVRIYSDEKYITISNQLQRKKDKEPSTGIGITNIRNRYALLGFGEIEIDSSSDHFIVKLPVIYSEK